MVSHGGWGTPSLLELKDLRGWGPAFLSCYLKPIWSLSAAMCTLRLAPKVCCPHIAGFLCLGLIICSRGLTLLLPFITSHSPVTVACSLAWKASSFSRVPQQQGVLLWLEVLLCWKGFIYLAVYRCSFSGLPFSPFLLFPICSKFWRFFFRWLSCVLPPPSLLLGRSWPHCLPLFKHLWPFWRA